MKRIKINIAVLALLAGSLAAFAFKAPAPKHFTNPYWQYNGGSVTSPLSYSELPGSPDCPGATNICAIEAPAQAAPHTNEPAISSGLSTRIQNKDTSAGDVFLKDN